ncbi:hypothetical protein RRG08_031481 [Elysia crispata]|uniref:Uncharacterized protein n=1 Tax=Elysia crispata TaxID=231223 RepID=A0AAE0ZNJ6_9GAST|nr:hypothetical protein RRG08_031481 [Elysia crispata]
MGNVSTTLFVISNRGMVLSPLRDQTSAIRSSTPTSGLSCPSCPKTTIECSHSGETKPRPLGPVPQPLVSVVLPVPTQPLSVPTQERPNLGHKVQYHNLWRDQTSAIRSSTPTSGLSCPSCPHTAIKCSHSGETKPRPLGPVPQPLVSVVLPVPTQPLSVPTQERPNLGHSVQYPNLWSQLSFLFHTAIRCSHSGETKPRPLGPVPQPVVSVVLPVPTQPLSVPTQERPNLGH